MSKFNPTPFSVTRVQTPDYSGYERAGAAIGSAIGGSIAKNREKKEQAELEKAIGSYMEKIDTFRSEDTGLIDTQKAEQALGGKLLGDPKIRSSIMKQVDEMNKRQNEQNAADIERASLSLAYQDRDGSTYDSLLPGLHDEAYAKSMQEWQSARGKQLDQENTQSLIANRGAENTPESERKIQQYMRANPNSTWVEAYNAVNTSILPDPGGTGLYRTTPGGDVSKVELNRWSPPSKDELLSRENYGDDPLSLYGRVSNSTTGLVPAAKDVLQRWVMGPINSVSGSDLSVIDPDVQQTWQEFLSVQRSLVRSLQENPKYPEGERKSIADEINIAPGALKDQQSLKAYIRGVSSFLDRKLDVAIRIRDDESRSFDERGDAQRVAENIAFTLYQLDVPSEKNKKLGSPAEVDPDIWQYMTEEERALWGK